MIDQVIDADDIRERLAEIRSGLGSIEDNLDEALCNVPGLFEQSIVNRLNAELGQVSTLIHRVEQTVYSLANPNEAATGRVSCDPDGR